ncbi:hypothetical protein [Microbulbifer hainanensis]|uniref:hypothetical protein n=1 Tax=Microbulbifer hainanensis TaxID=2735675 RepID=UPI00186902C9|nr:hypothetical protein [Microbulbifer hainanensis]
MRLSDYRQTYYDISGISSSVTRQVAFAGIALVWIFNNKSGSNVTLPEPLLWPTLFLIACLACDLLQYIAGSAIWGLFHRVKERQGTPEDEILKVPVYLNWPSISLFWCKHIFVLFGYFGLFNFVYGAIKFSS